VIPNGVDLDLPAAQRRRKVILAAGRLWDEAKNAAALARVAPELPWPVLMAGEAPPDGLAGPVRCLGRLGRPELHRLMVEAAIFASPARYEPFGLAALEAAHAGCALVLGNLPSLVEVWGDAARFVPPDDAQALRRTLLDLIDDKDALLGLQQAARQRARVFSRRHMREGYLALYRTVLGGDAPWEGRAA